MNPGRGGGILSLGRRLQVAGRVAALCALVGVPPGSADSGRRSDRGAGLDGSRVSPVRRAPVDTATFDYTAGGVHVIQRLTPNNEVVVAELYLLGGVMELTAANAGVEEMALRAGQYGSTRYPGALSRQAFSGTGSRWLVSSGTDWSTVGFIGIADGFDSTWAVFADRIVHPTLDSASIALVRAQMLKESRLRGLTPEGVAFELADSAAFVGHPYGLRPSGTEASLNGITRRVVSDYVQSHFATSRMLLVVVGNIPRAKLEPLVAATLGTLPAGSFVRTLPPDPPRHPTAMTMVARPSATNYILGFYTGPSVASRDYPAFMIATELLSARLSGAIRARTGLSYAAFAPYEKREISAGGLYASTSLPSLVFALMRQQVDSVKAHIYPAFVLRDYESRFKSGFLLRNETNESQAALLAQGQIYFSDYRQADAELKRLHDVSPDDVVRAARAYIRDIQFVYVGDTTLVRREWVKSM